MTTLKQPIFCHCDLSFGEHKVDKSFDGTIPFGLWIGVCFLIVVAVLVVVMGVAVYKGARQMNGVWGGHSNMVVTYRDEESTRQAQQVRSETHRSYLPSPSSDFTLDTRPSNPVIECRGGKC